MNWIEDRRLDNWTYKNRPGYRGYFRAMYNKYFHSKWIDKGLKSSEYRTETLDSYDMRIKNLMNVNTDLDALRGLREISVLIDLDNIDRLQNTKEAFEVGLNVFRTMLKYLSIKKPTKKVDKKTPKPKQPKTPPPPFDEDNEDYTAAPSEDEDDEDGDPQPSDGEPKEDPNNLDPVEPPDEESPTDDSKTEPSDEKSDDESKEGDKTDETKEDETKPEEPKDEKPVEGSLPSVPGEEKKDDEEEFDEDEVTKGDGDLEDKEKDALDKALKDQDEFLNGETPKDKLSEENANKLDIVSESGSSIVDVDFKDSFKNFKVPVLLIKNVTESFFKDAELCKFSSWKSYETVQPEGMYQEYVTKGITLGKLLGRKLQIRNESKVSKDIRRDTGRIERRLLAGLGYGYTNVFSRTSEEKFPRAILHLSIDASGSMGGDRLGKAITAAVAIAKFCSMNATLHCVISVRASQGSLSEAKPMVAIIYDSRIDKFAKIQWMMPYVKTFGGTPEGLCFAAIQKEIESSSADLRSYFINLSDGEPCFSINISKDAQSYRNQECSYGSGAGVQHTKGEVNKMRGRGIKVLSYFISDSESYLEDFKTMYGKDARNIRTDNLPELARTLEELLLRKDF
jgi:hypothetical protein